MNIFTSERFVRYIILTIGSTVFLSFIGLICSWLFLDPYISYFIKAHPGSVENNSIGKISVIVGLLFRSLLSIGWIFSFFYIRKLIITRHKYAWLSVLLVSIIGIAGYGYYVIQGAPIWLELIRSGQLILSFISLILIIFSPAGNQLKFNGGNSNG